MLNNFHYILGESKCSWCIKHYWGKYLYLKSDSHRDEFYVCTWTDLFSGIGKVSFPEGSSNPFQNYENYSEMQTSPV